MTIQINLFQKQVLNILFIAIIINVNEKVSQTLMNF